MAVPLLNTKFYLPPVRSTVVPRPRLLSRLDEGMKRPLTLISAPAGFGKTTLVSEWRASDGGRDVPLAWVSLDSHDSDPIRFLSYLISALARLKPGLGEAELDMLQAPQPPPFEPLLTGLINDLSEFDAPLVLVLDDYHVIHAQPVHEVLAFLLDNLPRPMHLLLLTRADPPLPLARLRARDQMVEIRGDDLRFTQGEAALFLNQVMGLDLSAADVGALEDRTEGWIAGLQLAAVSLQSREDPSAFIATFGGGHHYIVDYLVEEVLDRQADSLRRFLLQTSILDRLSGSLCDALTEQSDGQATLEQLDGANLFISRLDNDGHWYRYHHLFGDVLATRLRQSSPDQVPELHRRAAAWLEAEGLVSEAIHHSLAAGDQPGAARLVEHNALAMLMHGEAVTVLKWIEAVASLLGERPWLGIHLSWAFICTGQFDKIEAVLEIAEGYGSGRDPDAAARRGHIVAIRAFVAARRGEAQHAMTLARQALEQLPASEAVIRSVAVFTLGEASWQTGELAEARRAFAEASRIDGAAGNVLAAVVALSCTAILLTEQGDLHRAKETYQTALQMATRSDGRRMPAAAQACLGLAGLAYEGNDLETAARHAEQALELGSRWGNPNQLGGTRLIRARLMQARGDAPGAYEELRQAAELTRDQAVTDPTVPQVGAYRVRLWLAQSNLEAAAAWARGQALAPSDKITYPRQIPYLALARILMAQRRDDEALSLLERLLAQVEGLGQTGRALEVLVLRSLALETRGDTTGALSDLARALTLGEAEGYVRVFLDEGEPIADLLRRAGSRGIAPQYVAKLLAEFAKGGTGRLASHQPLIEPLTDRELQVLRLVADGLSNQAIAAQLVVAVGTVKAHTASLYRKLDVASRTQAVARARDLGLL